MEDYYYEVDHVRRRRRGRSIPKRRREAAAGGRERKDLHLVELPRPPRADPIVEPPGWEAVCRGGRGTLSTTFGSHEVLEDLYTVVSHFNYTSGNSKRISF